MSELRTAVGGHTHPYLAESIEYVVKVDEDLAFGDFGNVVHGLAGVVPHTSVLVSKAGKDGRHNP